MPLFQWQYQAKTEPVYVPVTQTLTPLPSVRVVDHFVSVTRVQGCFSVDPTVLYVPTSPAVTPLTWINRYPDLLRPIRSLPTALQPAFWIDPKQLTLKERAQLDKWLGSYPDRLYSPMGLLHYLQQDHSVSNISPIISIYTTLLISALSQRTDMAAQKRVDMTTSGGRA